MPHIEGKPGEELAEVWIYLSEEEVEEMRAAFDYRAEELAEGLEDPGWHVHIGGPEPPQVTISVGAPATE